VTEEQTTIYIEHLGQMSSFLAQCQAQLAMLASCVREADPTATCSDLMDAVQDLTLARDRLLAAREDMLRRYVKH
jgi:hypothetical protein